MRGRLEVLDQRFDRLRLIAAGLNGLTSRNSTRGSLHGSVGRHAVSTASSRRPSPSLYGNRESQSSAAGKADTFLNLCQLDHASQAVFPQEMPPRQRPGRGAGSGNDAGRRAILSVSLLAAGGCRTHLSLRYKTLATTETLTDLNYQQVLDNLARSWPTPR